MMDEDLEYQNHGAAPEKDYSLADTKGRRCAMVMMGERRNVEHVEVKSRTF
jgi:hypothetical protein